MSAQADVRSLDRLLALGEWKAAALIGGAALEALLLEALRGRPWDVAEFRAARLAESKKRRDDGARWDKPLEEWGLYGLIAAAGALGILGAAELVDLLHRARRARNSIHAAGDVSETMAREVAEAVLVLMGLSATAEARAS